MTAASGSISLTPQVPSGVMTIIDGALSVRVRPDFSQVINYTLGVSLLLVSMVEPLRPLTSMVRITGSVSANRSQARTT